MALVLDMSMSLDGFIAGPGGDMSWLTEHFVGDGGESATVARLLADVGAILVGHNTFGGDDPNRGTDKEGAFEGAWHGPQFVLTHHPPRTPVEGVTFVEDLATALSAAKDAAGDRYVNVLGADVARQCVEADALDEVLTIVAPVLLGDGTRLFEQAGGRQVQLERVRVTELPHATNLWFRVLR